MSISLGVGSDVIRSYQRLSYKVWYALAELIDNATQSFQDCEAELGPALAAAGDSPEVRIVYDRDNDLLRISDNAMGMSYEELEHALKIGRKPRRQGRSQYGMGLKTAACWLGGEWSVITKKLGEPTEHTVTVNVERVASGDLDLRHQPLGGQPLDRHYTIIEIRQLNVKIAGRTKSKTKEFLRSMYRIDLRTNKLKLYFEDNPLEWKDDLIFMTAHDGTPYKKPINFSVSGKTVSGWIGILGPGSSGRPNAGFTILRYDRVIRGFPDAWRPEEIFGQVQGSNDVVNQRIAGELHVNDFAVSHTKDDILWGNDEAEVQVKLREEATDYIAIAKVPFKNSDARGPSPAEVQVAVDELKTELQSKEFVDLIEIDTVPPPEVIESSAKPMLEAAKSHEPKFYVTVGVLSVRLYLSTDASPMDLYYNSDVTAANLISVVVNVNHPHWSQLAGSESVLTYLRQCVFDAVAEWQCRRQTGAIQPHTIKALKDGLLRLPSRMEDAATAVRPAAEA